MGQSIFITGTDTGVGKTVFTAAFLALLRNRGRHVWALKPICSGNRSDALLLAELQGNELGLETVNPIYFDDPVAPLVAARRRRVDINLASLLRHIENLRRHCELLLIEGCGGVMVPLTETHFVADFIRELGASTIIVAANKLGVINHTLLTMRALDHSGIKVLAVILMDPIRWDLATRTNLDVLAKMLKPIRVLPFNHLGRCASRVRGVKNNLGKIEKTLASLLEMDILTGV